MLDALHKVKWDHDGTLTLPPLVRARRLRLRRDAHQRHATGWPARRWSRTSTRPKPITVEPIQGLPVLKDLIVDMEPFFEALPVGDAVPGHRPAPSRPASGCSRRRTATGSTTPPSASCAPRAPPRARSSGPTGSTSARRRSSSAHRFIFDSRDEGADERLEILNDQEGVWRCRTTFNCTEACPRGIEVTKAIQEVKRALIFRR